MTTDSAILAEALDRAIDELLRVRLALGDHSVALPDIALDEALRQHPAYQDGRREFATAIDGLVHAPLDRLPEVALDVESAANTMLGRAVEVAWRLGLRCR